MSTRFGINLDELASAAKDLQKSKENINKIQMARIAEVVQNSSRLISVQSFTRQLIDLSTNPNGILEVLSWHFDEATCVVDCLNKAGQEVCYVEDNLESVFRGAYDSVAERHSHVSPLVEPAVATGRGMKFRDGRLFPSFVNTTAPIDSEAVGRSIQQLSDEFNDLDPMVLVSVKAEWETLEKGLAAIVKDIRKVAFKIQNAGTEDTFTYEAGLGVFRWADSISGLRHGVRAVVQKQESFVENYINTSNELQEISAKRSAAADNPAFSEFSFPEGQFTARADQVLSTTYNPGLAAADTSSIEIAVPMRAVITEKVREPVIEIPEAVAPPRPQASIQADPSRLAAAQDAKMPQPPAGSQQGPGSIEAPEIKGAEEPAETKKAGIAPTPSTTTPPSGGNPQAPSWGGTPKAPPSTTRTAGYVPYAYGQPYQMRGSRGEYINPRTKLPNSNIPLSFFQEQQRRRFDLDYWHQHPHYPGNNGQVGGKLRAENGNISGATRSTSSGTGNTAKNNTGAGARGAMMPGGIAGAGKEQNKSGGRRRRAPRSAKNTHKILQFDENGAIRGVIRHPSDPLFGTGR